MKEKTFFALRKISHIILFIVSLSFTLFLFIEFGEKLHQKILWGLLGFALEIIKLYLFMLAKSGFKEKDWHIKIGALLQFIVYLGIMFTSMIATIGFAMTTIEGQSFSAQVKQNTFEINSIEVERDEITKEITILQQQQASLPEGWITASQRLSDSILSLREQREELNNKIRDLRKERLNEQIIDTSNVFVLIGSIINLDGKSTLYYLMLIMVITLEVCLVITCGDIEKKISKIHVYSGNKIFEYIEALFDVDGKRLKTDFDISNILNIPIEECINFRKTLSGITYKGVPMISQRRGGTKANFTKENIIKIVKFHFNTIAS